MMVAGRTAYENQKADEKSISSSYHRTGHEDGVESLSSADYIG